jgi:hypothetical protein
MHATLQKVLCIFVVGVPFLAYFLLYGKKSQKFALFALFS